MPEQSAGQAGCELDTLSIHLATAGICHMVASLGYGIGSPMERLPQHDQGCRWQLGEFTAEQLASFMRRETFGCNSVASSTSRDAPKSEVIDLMVARGGIEPPTRGFSGAPEANRIQPKPT